ncbi:MAG: type IV pilus secretin PilQ [Deltaproteobacteria bacterium]|nr:type IV pilus secretin PilQ [Deltaproteobacteria bacterium]
MNKYPRRSNRKARLSILGIGILASAILPLSCAPKKAPVPKPVAVTPAPQVQKAAPPQVIENITVDRSADGKAWLIAISGVHQLRHTIVKNIEPLSLTVFLPLVGLGTIQQDMTVDNEIIKTIHSVQRGPLQNPSSEITIGLKKDVEYEVDIDDTTLVITLTPTSMVAREETSSAAPSLEPAPIKREELLLLNVSEKKPTAKNVLDIRFVAEKMNSWVQVLTDGVVEKWKNFVLKDPDRLVVDISNVRKVFPKSRLPGDKMPFNRLRTAQRESDVRIVLDFLDRPMPPYDIRSEEDMLVIALGVEASRASAAPASAPAAPPAKVTRKTPSIGRVKSIEFKEIDDRTRITVRLSEKSEYTIDREDENTLVLLIKRCRIPSYLQRFIDTTYRDTSVSRIIPEADKKDPRNTRILIKLKQMAPFFARQEEKDIYIDIDKPAEPPIPVNLTPRPSVFPEVEKKPPPAISKPLEPVETPSAVAVQPEAPPQPPAPAVSAEPAVIAPEEIIPGLEAPAPRVYTGRRISLDFQDADINHLFRLIAEVSNLNIIAGENVKGKVTVRLVDVPWDQALDVILETNKLGKERIGNVIRVAPTSEIRAAREERLRQQKKRQDIIAEMQEKRMKAEPLTTKLVPVNFAEAKSMVEQIQGLLSDRGNVRTDTRTNTLIITDVSRNVENAAAMVKKLDTPTPQVLIEARVVEASTDFTRELGVRWGGRFASSPSTGNAFNGNNVNIGGTPEGGDTPSGSNWVVNLPAATGLGSGGALGFTLGSIMNTLLLDIQLSALESSGAGRIVSHPRVTTLDNKEAIITQGSRIPYPKQTQDGISTDFIDATLNMKVTPHITFDGSILMKIEIKKEAPDFTRIVLGVPAVDTRRASTEVLVKNGETTVIGGIVTREDTASMSGVPWVNRLPFVRNLFRSRQNVRNESELLIFITPRIVIHDSSARSTPWKEEQS